MPDAASLIDRRDTKDVTTPIAHAPDATWAEWALLGEMSATWLAALAALPVAAGAWLLLTPDRVLSRQMVWDLLFNLAGAWRIHSGQLPHVDFHDPVGPLSFLLTRAGFLIAGPNAHAFLVGEVLFAVIAFAAAVVAASRRLAPVPAILFVVYAGLLVLMPANLGDEPNAYSFAMSYNRFGWSALTTLCLLLFVPPRGVPSLLAALEAGVSAILVLALFYLKITFAAAGLGVWGLASTFSPHVRARRRTWSVALAAVVVGMVAPYNYPYLSDVWQAANAGYVRGFVQEQVRNFVGSKAEHALSVSGLLLIVWLWRRGRAPLASVVVAVALFTLGLGLLSQNAQERDVPLAMMVGYLLYDAIRHECRERGTTGARAALVPLMAILTLPALSIMAGAATLVGYHAAAARGDAIATIEATNLRGVAVPRDQDGVARALAEVDIPHQLLSSTRDQPLRDQVSQHEYVRTLIDAAALFAGDRRGRAKILVLDQVNPIPFMLGYPAPRGGNLWFGPEAPVHPAADVFGDADIVLIPKFSTYARATVAALTHYHDYLSEHFPAREDSRSWTILSRRHGLGQPAY